jgi:GNAT superfamily N-acetyltransferase
VFVALIGAVRVGFLAIDLTRPVATVEQVFVHHEARELGFGDALLAAAVDAARGSGATWLEGHTLPGDRNIKNLYERAGIVARLITTYRAF